MTDRDTLHAAHLTVKSRIEPAQVAALQAIRDRVDGDDV